MCFNAIFLKNVYTGAHWVILIWNFSNLFFKNLLICNHLKAKSKRKNFSLSQCFMNNVIIAIQNSSLFRAKHFKIFFNYCFVSLITRAHIINSYLKNKSMDILGGREILLKGYCLLVRKESLKVIILWVHLRFMDKFLWCCEQKEQIYYFTFYI